MASTSGRRLLPEFTLHLEKRIKKGKVTIGKFDGKHPCLAAVTDSDKIFIHVPHEHEWSGSDAFRYLNINKTVTSLESGPLDISRRCKDGDKRIRDVIMIGTRTKLRVYDVKENEDLFHVDASDGIRKIAFGRINGQRMAVIGGNCSIQGFDASGKEQFWTVTGGNVSAISFLTSEREEPSERDESSKTSSSRFKHSDNANGESEIMLVGSDDYDIRHFHGDEVVNELAETDCVSHLALVRRVEASSRDCERILYAYGLKNGTIGVYEGATRLWRVKSKHKLTALVAFDLDADGEPEIVSGWSNGCIDIRRAKDGQIVYRETLSAPIAALLTYDYRLCGQEQLICCTTTGEIRGYLPVAGIDGGGSFRDDTRRLVRGSDVRNMESLLKEKQRLMLELEGMESAARRGESKSGDGSIERPSSRARRDDLVLVEDKDVSVETRRNASSGCVDVIVSLARTNAVILSVAAFALEGAARLMGDDEEKRSVATYPLSPSSNAKLSLRPAKCGIETKLELYILVAARANSQVSRVVTKQCSMCPFMLYVPVAAKDVKSPRSSVCFDAASHSSPKFASQRSPATRVAMWISEAFGVSPPHFTPGSPLLFTARSIRDDQSVVSILFAQHSRVELRCDDMEIAAGVFQGICRALDLREVESVVDFPDTIRDFKESVLNRVDALREARTCQMADMAERSNVVKSLVVRAEDARILGAMPSLRNAYAQLYSLNNRLVGEFENRRACHDELVGKLREVNRMIQTAASLRLGSAKSRVVAACRSCLKRRKYDALCQAIRSGGS